MILFIANGNQRKAERTGKAIETFQKIFYLLLPPQNVQANNLDYRASVIQMFLNRFYN